MYSLFSFSLFRPPAGKSFTGAICLACFLVMLGVPVLGYGFRPIEPEPKDLALSGYDAVAYFSADSARKGYPIYEYRDEVTGKVWRFCNRANLEAFRRGPARYYPVVIALEGDGAEGNLEPDPRLFEIQKGRLYLFASAEARQAWLEHRGELLILAGR